MYVRVAARVTVDVTGVTEGPENRAVVLLAERHVIAGENLGVWLAFGQSHSREHNIHRP